MPYAPSKSHLAPGVAQLSRTLKATKSTAADKVVEGKGGKRVIPAVKAPRFYPTEDAVKPKVTRKRSGSVPLRASITPGTVAILLAGRYRGKRVVVLKQLESGLLLVTGPFKINGVPLKRVNQAYVIATSTKIDLSGVKIDDKLNDAYFGKKGGKKAAAFLEGAEAKKAALPESRVADQKAVDKAILEVIAKTPYLRQYLASTFGLSKGEFPHNLKF